METLDVTKIEPKFKHPAIFQRYEDLPVGQSFILLNDHDPKPLYYQFKAEKGEEFGWEYLEEGPVTWQVKISKLKVD